MKKVFAFQLKQNDILVNLGTIEKIIQTDQHTACTITKGKCISAAFYWFEKTTELFIESK